MAIEPIGATITAPLNSAVTIAPPAGETWAILHINGDNGNGRMHYALGKTAGTSTPELQNAGEYMAPPGPLILTSGLYLSIFAAATGGEVGYSGVKL